MRAILHSDMNSYYASVEMMLNPKLRGKAIAVCGSTETRHGIVLAKSELAKRHGVKTGMANWEAQRCCPGLITVPPHYEQYIKYSKLAHEIYGRYKQTNNTFVKPSIKTVSELMYDFMNLYGVNEWALSTYDGKKGLIDNYINPIIGKVKIKDITPRFMDEYYRKLLKVQRVMRNGQSFEGETVSPRNVREIHKILNCAFNQAVRWELLETNPVSKATLPKCENKVRDIWTMEDLSKKSFDEWLDQQNI